MLYAIERQLRHEPCRATRNRKRLEANDVAPWELRVGNLRVFYDVNPAEETVIVLAVGRKDGNKVWIGGAEIDL